jgi:hypothetical protein
MKKVFALPLGGASSHSYICAEVMTRFGKKALSVPAFTLREFCNFPAAKFLASISLWNVLVFLE